MDNNISEEIVLFVRENIPHLEGQVFQAFFNFFKYQIPNMEEKYFEAINNEDDDFQKKADNFIALISRDLLYIVNAHGITLTTDEYVSLELLNRICAFTDLLQRQEDYSHIQGYLNSDEPPKYILANIFEALKLGTVEDLIYVIEDVSPELIDSIGQLIEASVEYEAFKTLPLERQLTILFLRYLGDFDSLGKRLFEGGYDRIIPFEDLCDILPKSIDELLEFDNNGRSHVLKAIDLLSLFMICQDTQKDPINYFKENSEDFLSDINVITLMTGTMIDMYTDFERENDQILREIKDADNH